jgi:hypothetical protein
MSVVVYFFDIVTMIISAYWALVNVKKLKTSTRYIIYYTFFVICIFPLFMDYIIGKPMYELLPNRYHGFVISYDDSTTRVLYDIFLMISQYIMLKCFWRQRYKFVLNFRPKQYGKEYVHNNDIYDFRELNRVMQRICVCVALIAPIIAIIGGYTIILFVFGWRDEHLFDYVTASSLYSFMEKFSYLGATMSLLLMFSDYREKRTYRGLVYRIISIPLLIMNICIESKRSIIFFCFIMLVVILIYGKSKEIKIGRIIGIASILATIVIVLSVIVKTQSRGYSGIMTIYSTLRIDIFRDDTIKMAIYGMLNPNEIKILDFPFQSYLMQIRYFFFMDIIAGKGFIPLQGLGFNKYLSAALVGADLSMGYSFMTTSMFDEAIANFGVIGFLLAPIMCSIVTRNADKYSGFEKTLMVGCLVLGMMYSPNYILFYIEVTVVINLILKYLKMRYRGA